jgi:hypothetical protein
MDSPPAEPIKEENRQAFEAAASKYKARIDSIQARSIASVLFEKL